MSNQPPRGRGRATRGRGRAGEGNGGGQQQMGPHAPGGGQQRRPAGPWGNDAPPQPQGAWGPPRQVQQQQQVRAPVPRQESSGGRASYRSGEPASSAPGAVMSGAVSGQGETLATHGARGNIRGRRTMEGILHTRPPTSTLPSKQGSYGTRITLRANYFELLKTASWNLFQYRVDFAPEEDRTPVKKALLRRGLAQIVSGYLFDGTVLYSPVRLDHDPFEVFVENEGGERIRITIKMVGDVAVGDYHRLQVFNIILRKCMNTLKLQLVGRNFFDAVAKVSIPEFQMELWPGYITSIRQHERSILMCAEITHKVMRMDTVLHVLKECMRNERSNMKQRFQEQIIGCVVLTDYNNRTYRIDDVEWNVKPSSTFQKADGTTISYVEYYRSRYQLQIRDLEQPMLVSRAKPRELRAGMAENVFLVPELCRMTGLTDDQRSNFHLMRAVAQYTRVAPGARLDKLHQMCRRLLSQPEAVEELKKWDFQLARQVVEFAGRQLPPESIIGGNGAKYGAGERADWTRDLRSKAMFHGAEMKNWVVICPSRCKGAAHSFMQMLIRAAQGMQWRIPFPSLEEIPDDRPGTYLPKLEQVISRQPSFIMCIVTNNKSERYAAIKKKCSVDHSISSQVIVAKNLDSKGAMTIATKVVIQMNCKLGGAPWTVLIPLSGIMIVGYDVCHDTMDKTKSFGGMVASLDKNFTRYYNEAAPHTNGEELSNEFGMFLVKACKVYHRVNGAIPEKILIYRDGVGDGQLPYVYNYELEHIKMLLGKELYPNNTLKLGFIVVSKRINTRIFRGNENPAPGTVVDDVITLPERYDFFIVSQCVNQGTVSPTSYNIIYDTLGMEADHLQRLTYKLTHLYYNWSGTVRVPAPCQYAHKLAMLVGQYLHRSPHRELQTVLHFL